MAIFNSYVSLPEGMSNSKQFTSELLHHHTVFLAKWPLQAALEPVFTLANS